MARKKPMSKASEIKKKEQIVRVKKPRGNTNLEKAGIDRKRLKSIPITFEVDGPPLTADSPEWGPLIRRRGELISKRNREGLTKEEQSEYEELEKIVDRIMADIAVEGAVSVAKVKTREDRGEKSNLTDGWESKVDLEAMESTNLIEEDEEGPIDTGVRERLSLPPTAGRSIPFLSGKGGPDRNIVNSLSSSSGVCIDPIKLKDLLWPDIFFYKEQEEVIYSVLENDETYVVAANQMGKDFVAAYIVLYFFLSRTPCRILTTSVDHYQLEGVLWGEIRRFLQTSRYSLDSKDGGPLVINHMHLRKIIDGKMCGLSYMIGRVSAKGEGMLGHHIADVGDNIPRTLCCFDEGSGIDDINYEMCTTWAKRVLVIGNAWPTENFFRKAVENGDVPAGPIRLPSS